MDKHGGPKSEGSFSDSDNENSCHGMSLGGEGGSPGLMDCPPLKSSGNGPVNGAGGGPNGESGGAGELGGIHLSPSSNHGPDVTPPHFLQVRRGGHSPGANINDLDTSGPGSTSCSLQGQGQGGPLMHSHGQSQGGMRLPHHEPVSHQLPLHAQQQMKHHIKSESPSSTGSMISPSHLTGALPQKQLPPSSAHPPF